MGSIFDHRVFYSDWTGDPEGYDDSIPGVASVETGGGDVC